MTNEKPIYYSDFTLKLVFDANQRNLEESFKLNWFLFDFYFEMRTNEIAKERIQERSTLQTASVLEKWISPRIVRKIQKSFGSTTNIRRFPSKWAAKRKHSAELHIHVRWKMHFIYYFKEKQKSERDAYVREHLFCGLYRRENNQKEWHYPCGSKWLCSKVYWACIETCKRLCERSNSSGPYPIYFIH